MRKSAFNKFNESVDIFFKYVKKKLEFLGRLFPPSNIQRFILFVFWIAEARIR